jgi:hypothetical protein
MMPASEIRISVRIASYLGKRVRTQRRDRPAGSRTSDCTLAIMDCATASITFEEDPLAGALDRPAPIAGRGVTPGDSAGGRPPERWVTSPAS